MIYKTVLMLLNQKMLRGFWITVLAVSFSIDFIDAINLSDIKFSDTWSLQKIRMPDAWDITVGNENIIIAILDTGVDLDHPDFKEKIIAGKNFIDPNLEPNDDNGHGTQVAGIAIAMTNDGLINSSGIAGIAWKCKIMPIKVTTEKDSPDKQINLDRYYLALSNGFKYAAKNGAHVINIAQKSKI